MFPVQVVQLIRDGGHSFVQAPEGRLEQTQAAFSLVASFHVAVDEAGSEVSPIFYTVQEQYIYWHCFTWTGKNEV